MNKFKKCNFYLFSIILVLFFSCSSAFAKVLDIVMCMDNNYVYPSLVSMTSIVENKLKDTYPRFHLMISGSVSEENKQKLEKIEEIYGKNNCSVEIINMQDKFKGAHQASWSTPMYYRILTSSCLPQCEKALYLDGDTIITQDLQGLYDTDISDCYVAGCGDLDTVLWRDGYEKKLNIPDRNQYVNSGVLLLNLKNMRKNNIEKKMEDLVYKVKEKGFCFPDQDIINSVCYGKIKIIDPKYNVMVHFSPFNYRISKIIPKNILYKLRKGYLNPSIIHYTGGKPWNNPGCKKYDIWNRYREKVENNFYEKKIFEGSYKLVSALDENKVVNISGKSKKDRANVNLWKFNNSNSQKFNIYYDSQGTYKIKSILSGKVIDVCEASKNVGTNVIQYQEHSGDSEKWFLQDAGNGYFYIFSKCNNLCLDVEGANTKNGSNIRMWNFNGSNAQKFKFVKV